MQFDEQQWSRVCLIADQRRQRNRHKQTREGKSGTVRERIGVAAEVAFGIAMGQHPEKAFQRAADPKPTLGYQWEIDYKTYRVQGSDQPGHLIQRKDRTLADYYVLVHVDPDNLTAEIVGWCDRDELLSHPTRTHEGQNEDGPYEIVSHWVPAASLNALAALKNPVTQLRMAGD